MTAQAEIIPPSPAGAHDSLATYGHAGPPAHRYDGWTPERQRVFLKELSEGGTVTHACRVVGLSVQSAYAFRRAARGASFAIGWQAAQLLARETLADNLMTKALDGIFETVTHPDGTETTRHRHDCHFAFKMLGRMDRMADAAHHEATHAAARLVAGEFEQYLEMIGQDGGPVRAGLFLGARLSAEGVPASEDDLAPVRVLARADHWLRTTPISPSRSPPPISIPPAAPNGAPSNGPAPKPPASSSSRRRHRRRPSRPPKFLNFLNIRMTTLRMASRCGGTGSTRNGAPVSRRPRASTARRTANMAMRDIRAR